MKHRTAAARATGIEASIAPILPTNEKRIKKAAPISMARLPAIFVMLSVCTFSVKVVEPVPVPHNPARMLVQPSRPIPLLTIPGVGGFKFTSRDAA